MKTLQALFSNFFGTNHNDSISGDARQVLIKFYSQPDVLQQKMREKKIDTWRNGYCYFIAGSIAKRIWKIGLVFLSMEMIEILETISPGDGGHIPCDLKAEGLAIPRKHKTGLYRLKNVTLTSNGMMEIKATEKTEWERLDPKMFK